MTPARLDVVATVLLSAAGLASSWVGYQATRWGGVQAARYSDASTLRVEATRMSTEAGQRAGVDIGMFASWLNAFTSGNQRLASFLSARFRDEFRPAFNVWIASHPLENPNAAPSPFTLPEYRLAFADSSRRLELASKRAFSEAQAANQQSDQYVLLAVVFASVLFLAGISQQIPSIPSRTALLALAFGCCVFGLVTMMRYPVE